MLTGPSAFYTVASEILEAASDRLAETTAGRPDRMCVVDGEIAWDNCECGLLAVALSRIYLSAAFPTELVTVSVCDAPWAVGDLVVQTLRCAPQPAGQDLAPSCAALDASAQTVIADAYAVLAAVACRLGELRDADDIVDYLIRPQNAAGPAGRCVGSELRVSVAVPFTRT